MSISMGNMMIISGGQCGADRGALYAANEVGIKTGGFIPPGFKTDDNYSPEILQHTYNIIALNESQVDANLGKYRSKDKLNVDQSDALIAFLSTKVLSGLGTCQTANYAISKGEFGNKEVPEKPTDSEVLFRPGIKPVLFIWDVTDFDENTMNSVSIKIFNFILENKVKKLMIAGPTEKTIEGLSVAVHKLLKNTFKTFNH